MNVDLLFTAFLAGYFAECKPWDHSEVDMRQAARESFDAWMANNYEGQPAWQAWLLDADYAASNRQEIAAVDGVPTCPKCGCLAGDSNRPRHKNKRCFYCDTPIRWPS